MHWQLSEIQGHYELEPLRGLPTAFLYGYSVYTSYKWPIHDEWLDAHLERLAHDAHAMKLNFSWSFDRLKACLGRYQQSAHPVTRLTVIPEISSFRELLQDDPDADPIPSQLILSLAPVSTLPTRMLRLKTVHFQDPIATIKHGSLAAKLHLRRIAVAESFDDVLFINQAGAISEASTSNIFFIRGSGLYTPLPERDACLSGITRSILLKSALESNIPVSNLPILPDEIFRMDGAFLCNAVLGLQQIASIDSHSLPWPEKAVKLFETLHAIIER